MGSFRQLFGLRSSRPAADEAVDWEIRHHIEERADELEAEGLPPEEALREARRSFGDLAGIRREMRRVTRGRERGLRLSTLAGEIRDDVGRAARRLAASPALSLVVILVLGLGIGANTALFSALEAALLKGPPYPEPERLVLVDLLLARNADAPLDTLPWSYPKFEMARERLASLETVAGFFPATATLTGAGDPARIGVEYVSPAYFELLGVRPSLGRVFQAEEEPPDPGAVAVLGHALWAGRFGGDRGVLGRTLELDGATLQVVGVLPPGFEGLSGAAELFVPMAGVATVRGNRRLLMAWAHWLRAVGRLRQGVSLEQARAQATALGGSLTEAYPDPSGGGSHGVALVPLAQARVNRIARLAVGAVSLGAVLLLVIACANVAGLLLARASARRVDVAVRAALGAGRARLARESMAESMLLAVGGGALGLVLALGGERLVARAARYSLETTGSRNLQFLDPDALGVDGVVLAMGIGLALITGLLFGLLPARAGSRPDLTRDLREGGRGGIGAGDRDAAVAGRGLLVAGQLALTLVLLAGSGLMGASFARLAAVSPGFAHDRVLTAAFDRGPGRTAVEVRQFEERLLERLAALPGVEAAAVAPCAPLAGRCEATGLRQVDDRPPVDHGDMEAILTYAVSADYFRTLGIAVREGRTPDAGDIRGGPPVAVINETAARTLFPGTSPLGHRIGVTHELTEERLAEIVGVVADVRYADLEEPAMPAVYFSRRQAGTAYATVFLRTAGDPYALTDALRREVAALDPDLPLYDVTTMGDRRALATARTRVILWLLAAFAGTGLLLSAVGLYGLVSYAAVRRTREMGLRMALGAGAGHVLRLLLRPPALLAVAGCLAGVLGAVVLTRYVEGLLYEVSPADARVLAGASLVLLAVALTAAWLPARRATRLDPAETLRGE